MTIYGAATPVPSYIQRLPRARVVDRGRFIEDTARGQHVVHLGFGGGYDDDRRQGLWLHDRIAGVASRAIGVDIDAEVVNRANQDGYEAAVLDCTDIEAVRDAGLGQADLVIAGEIIEHLDAPGPFLTAMHALVKPGGVLLVTTPNAYSAFHFAATLANREVVHPDHVAVYSWYTLTNLLGRHGWDVTDAMTYAAPPIRARGGRSPALETLARAARWGRVVENRVLARWRPFTAEGLLFLCRATAGLAPPGV